MKQTKISIEIKNNGLSILNSNSFDEAILFLINEREWHNWDSKVKLSKKKK